MAITAADIRVKFSSDGADGVRKDITGVGGAVDTVQGKLSSWGANLRTTGAWLTAGVTTPLAAFFTTAIHGASSLEQAQGKVDAVFKDSANTVLAWSDTTSQAFGISNTQALQWTGTLGNFFTSAGVATDQSAKFSRQLIELSADMGAFNDVSAARASDAIISAFAGEYDALQRLGVNINAAKVEQEAMNIALADGREEVTDADMAMARYNVIMRETTNQQGQFARESKGFAGQLAILKARFSEVSANLGKILLPYATRFVDVLGDLVDWFDELNPGIQRWAVGLGLAAAALGPLLIAIGLMLPGLGAMIGLFAAMVSPLGLIAIAAGALAFLFRDELGAALEWLIGKVEFAINVFQNLREIGVEPLDAAFRTLEALFPSLQGKFDGLRAVMEALSFSFDAFRNGEWEAGFQRLGNVAESAWSRIREGLAVVGELAQAFGSWVLDVGAPTVTGWIVDFAADAWGALKTAAGVVMDVAADIGAWALDTAVPTVTGWLATAAGGIWNALVAAAGWTWDGIVRLSGWVLDVAAPTVGGWLSTLASNVWNGLVSAAGWAWSGVVDLASWVLNVAAPTASGWLSELGGDLWNGLVSAAGWAWSGVVDMPNWVLNTAVPTVTGWLEDVSGWLRGKITEALASFGITSTDLMVVGTSIAAALSEAVTLGLQSIADLGASVLTWLTEQMQGIDWGSLGNTIGQRLGEAIRAGIQGLAALVGLGAYLLAELLVAVVNVDWGTLGSSIKAFLQTALEAGFDFATGFIQGLFSGLFEGITFESVTAKGAELVQSFTNGFEIAWPATQAWLADLGNKALGAIGDLSGVLKDKGAQLIQGFWDGAKGVWNDFIGWLNGRDEDMDTISGEGEGGGGGAGASTLFGDWGASIAGMMEEIRAAVDTGMSAIRGTIESKASEWASALQGGIAPLGGIAATAFGAVSTSATTGLGAATAAVIAGTGQILAVTVTNLGSMAASALASFTSIRTTATTNTTAMQAGVTAGMNAMRATSTAAVAGMQAGIAASMLVMRFSAVSSANAMQSSVVAAMTNMALRSAAAVRSGMGQIPGIIASVGGAAAGVAFGVGAAIGNGVAAGMLSALGTIRAAANAMISEALRAAQARAIIASPSKLFEREVGVHISEGVAEGIERASGVVQRAVSDMLDVNGLLDRLVYLVNDEIIGAVRNSIPEAGTFSNPYTIGLPGTAGRRYPTQFDNRVIFEAGSIVQREGESTPELAERIATVIAKMQNRDLETVIGGSMV